MKKAMFLLAAIGILASGCIKTNNPCYICMVKNSAAKVDTSATCWNGRTTPPSTYISNNYYPYVDGSVGDSIKCAVQQ